MPAQNKTFRIFVSSTFSDMQQERAILQNEVFPKLEKLCESKGAKFQAVDLRWGVNEESQLDQKTMDICLGEIARCQRISPKPNFIALIGDRYGWQPLPVKIPATEMDAIMNIASGRNKELLNSWYKLDENAIPSEFVLQPRNGDSLDYKSWEKTETEIRNVLRASIEKLNFLDEQKIKYFASATHQEIINGALNPPKNIPYPEEHVFAYVRTIKELPADETAKGFIDLTDEKPDAFCQMQLNKLKHQLHDTLNEKYYTYDTRWEDISTGKADLTGFAQQVYHDISTILNEQTNEITNDDEIQYEIKLHEEFKNRLTENFIGRHESLIQIEDYLNDTTENKVLAVIGDSGSGKSSLMAQAIKNCEAKTTKARLFYRFIGTSSQTSNPLSFLISLSAQIAAEYNTTLEVLVGEGKEKDIYSIQGIADAFKKCLMLATTDNPMIFFIDALDQFSENTEGNALFWIPLQLPDNAKMVVSTLPGLASQLKYTKTIQLPVLPTNDAKQILERWLAANNRKLTTRQSSEILEKFNKNGLPIYLKLAFERARHWHSYDVETDLSADVRGIINNFFEYLEKEHTEAFVRNTVCYMLSGRYQGLTENEILEILVFDKEYWNIFMSKTHPDHRKELEGVTKIPIVVWSRLYLDLEPFLTERDAHGIPIITFFHRQFVEVLIERYRLSESLN